METKIYNKIKELMNITGTNAKGSWIKENLSEKSEINGLILDIMRIQFDPRVTTNLANKSMKKNNAKSSMISIETVPEFLEYISEECTGKDVDIANILNYLDLVEEFHGEDVRNMFEDIAIQNLKLGVTGKSINKALRKEVIFEWNIQGGKPYDSVKLKQGEEFVLQLKLNGVRASLHNKLLMARGGTAHFGFNTILNELQQVFEGKYFVDGELIRKNIDSIPDNENFRKTLSIVNSKQYLPEKEGIILRIYDIIPIEEYESGNFKMKYVSERMKFIQSFKDKMTEHLEILPVDYVGNDINKIQELLDKYDALGLEGLMLYRDATYQKSKHSGLLKVKSFKFSDLEIVDYYLAKEEGKYKNMFGGFVVNYKGNTVDIGGGYTDEQREYFTERAKEYIGRIAEVKYKEESQDSVTKKYSLQFPVFQTIREIGKEVSYE